MFAASVAARASKAIEWSNSQALLDDSEGMLEYFEFLENS